MNEFEENIKNITQAVAKILVEKNKGYGNSFYDSLNEVKQIFMPILKEHKLFKYIHYLAFYQREHDKIKRFINLIANVNLTEEIKEKKLYDAVLDFVGYGILFLNYLDTEGD